MPAATSPLLRKIFDPAFPEGALPQKMCEGQLYSTQRAVAMYGALMESSEAGGGGYGIAGGALDV